MGPMPRTAATVPIVLAILTSLIAGACGSLSGGSAPSADAATATVAPPTTAVVDTSTPTAAVETDSAEAATAEPAPTAAGNGGAWAAAAAGAQRFAAALDHANQAIASCETDMSAGADFEACVGDSYREIADASATLAGVAADAGSQADGACADAIGEVRDVATAMSADYTRAVEVTDRTSRETIRGTLADDAQSYADAALAAESACTG